MRTCMQDSSELPAHAKDKEAGTLNMSHSAFDMGRSLGDCSFPLNLLWTATWSQGLLQKLNVANGSRHVFLQAKPATASKLATRSKSIPATMFPACC